MNKEDKLLVRQMIKKIKREREWNNKMGEGLMNYYKSDDWQRHISNQKEKERIEKEKQLLEVNKKIKKWWQRIF